MLSCQNIVFFSYPGVWDSSTVRDRNNNHINNKSSKLFLIHLFFVCNVQSRPLTAGKVEVLVIILIKFLTTEKYNHETFKYGNVLTLHHQFECHRTIMECHSRSCFSNIVSLYFTNWRQNYEYKIKLTDRSSEILKEIVYENISFAKTFSKYISYTTYKYCRDKNVVIINFYLATV